MEINKIGSKGGFGNKGFTDRMGEMLNLRLVHLLSTQPAVQESLHYISCSFSVFTSIQLLPFKMPQSVSQGALHNVIMT